MPPPTLTHEGEAIMGSTLVRKWGRRPDSKKEETEVEICGTERSHFSAMFFQVCRLILAYGMLYVAPSRKYLHAYDYSAVIARNDIFAPLLTIPIHRFDSGYSIFSFSIDPRLKY